MSLLEVYYKGSHDANRQLIPEECSPIPGLTAPGLVMLTAIKAGKGNKKQAKSF
jgi:hypothetical protein